MKPPDFHPEARLELRQAVVYYLQHASAEIALGFDARVSSALAEIGDSPERFPHWQRTHARRYLLKQYPFQVFYVEYPEYFWIVAIAHTSRRPGYWKSRMRD